MDVQNEVTDTSREAMTTPFSAGPQAIGYLHQVRYALYALLRENHDYDEAAVVIEGLDDIEVSGKSGSIRLDQLKHHIRGSAKLTDASPDLWKTIRIWSSQMRNKNWEPTTTRLSLVTTATTTEGTAAWYLQAHNERNVAKARELLLKVISTSRTRDKAILDAFTAFESLSEREQMHMLRAVTIFDGAHTITDLPSLIKQQIRFAAPPSGTMLDRLYETLEGWWFARAVEHLVQSSQEPITLMYLRRKLWSITDRLQEDNLPIDYAEALPDTGIDPDTDDRVFVQQLRCLAIKHERIKQAILDYYRAFKQRARWVDEDLVGDDEVITYERKLVDMWNHYRLEQLDDVPDQDLASDEQCQTLGRELLRRTQDVDIRIRPNVDERFLLRGSYHILANMELPRVYWHPKFLERLVELLTS
jgi:hypothetical protein